MVIMKTKHDSTRRWMVGLALGVLTVLACPRSLPAQEEVEEGEETIERLRRMQEHQLTPEQYNHALDATGMLAAKQAEWAAQQAEGDDAAPRGVDPGWVSIGPIGSGPNGNGRISAIQVYPTSGG